MKTTPLEEIAAHYHSEQDAMREKIARLLVPKKKKKSRKKKSLGEIPPLENNLK